MYSAGSRSLMRVMTRSTSPSNTTTRSFCTLLGHFCPLLGHFCTLLGLFCTYHYQVPDPTEKGKERKTGNLWGEYEEMSTEAVLMDAKNEPYRVWEMKVKATVTGELTGLCLPGRDSNPKAPRHKFSTVLSIVTFVQ